MQLEALSTQPLTDKILKGQQQGHQIKTVYNSQSKSGFYNAIDIFVFIEYKQMIESTQVTKKYFASTFL